MYRVLEIEKFKKEVSEIYQKKRQCLVAVSEGISNEEGIFISSSSGLKDAFGHFQLGGVASKLASTVSADLGIPSRPVEFGSTQRAASHIQSLTDVNEAIEVGRQAVRAAISKKTNLMVVMNRSSKEQYEITYDLRPLNLCANTEKKVSKSMINSKGNGITKEFINYVLPLIQGENLPQYKNGIQQFSKMK